MSTSVGLLRDPDHPQHAEPLGSRARVAMTSSHSREGWFGQRHQTLSVLSDVTESGVTLPFLSGCHSRASLGWVTDNGALDTAT